MRGLKKTGKKNGREQGQEQGKEQETGAGAGARNRSRGRSKKPEQGQEQETGAGAGAGNRSQETGARSPEPGARRRSLKKEAIKIKKPLDNIDNEAALSPFGAGLVGSLLKHGCPTISLAAGGAQIQPDYFSVHGAHNAMTVEFYCNTHKIFEFQLAPTGVMPVEVERCGYICYRILDYELCWPAPGAGDDKEGT